MRFEDIYKEGVMIICRNQEESDRCRQFLSSHGVKYGSGRDVIDKDYWGSYTTMLGYVFHEWDPGVFRVYYDSDRNVLEGETECGYTFVPFKEINTAESPTKEFDTLLLMELYK